MGQPFVDTHYTYMATEARIDSIAWGGLLAWVASRFSAQEVAKLLDNKWVVFLSCAILLMTLLVRDERFRESTRYTLQGASFLAIFYSSLYGSTLGWTRRVLANKLATKIGKLSYSIYLYHWFALVCANWLIGPEKLAPAWLVFYYGLSMALAGASYKWIEQPTLAIRRKFGSHAAA